MFQAKLVALSCLNYQNISEIGKVKLKSDFWHQRGKYMEKPKSSAYTSPLRCRFILQHDKLLHMILLCTYLMIEVVGLYLEGVLFS